MIIKVKLTAALNRTMFDDNNNTTTTICTSYVSCAYHHVSFEKASPHVRESMTVLDSGFHAVDSGF